MILPAILLTALFGLPGVALLATAAGNGAAPWPWPRGVTLSFALGATIAGLLAVGLGVIGDFRLSTEIAAVVGTVAAILVAGGFRLAWPFCRATAVESAGFFLVGSLAAGLFLGRPFEMLIGGRDATVYVVSGVGLARQGSLILRDRAIESLGSEIAHRFYPVQVQQGWLHWTQYVKYPGFYYVDVDQGHLIAQGLPLLPALIAIFYAALGLSGAFAANNLIGVLAVLSVFAVGTCLVGDLAATLGASLLTLDLVQVWAARYPTAEILFQLLLFSGLSAFLQRGRFGQTISGLLLGAALFAKIEAMLIFLPLALFGIAGAVRGRPVLGRSFWLSCSVTVLLALAYSAVFQVGYLRMAFISFSGFETRVLEEVFHRRFVWILLALAAGGAATSVAFAGRSLLRPLDLVRVSGRVLALTLALSAAYGYWVRPRFMGLLAGQQNTLIWLSWYVSPAVLFLGVTGLAHYLWTKARREALLVLAVLLLLSAVFLHFTFVNLLHIYLTRRFVPAVLPLVCLFAGYFMISAGGLFSHSRQVVAVLLAAILFAGAAGAIVRRSRHVYTHREYAGLADQFAALADSLRSKDLILLSDRSSRDLLGPALEFVFGLKTVVVWPKAYKNEGNIIRSWLERGTRLAALTSEVELESVPDAQEFDRVGQSWLGLRTLAELPDRFPNEFWEGGILFSRYAAGPGSDPLYEYWKREGERLIRAICPTRVRLLGGSHFLVRRVRARCEDSSIPDHGMGYLVGDSDAAAWETALQLYGARFVRHDFGGAVMFDEISPRAIEGTEALSPAGWKLEASDGRNTAWLAFDGRLDTRWGSAAPQRPGMSFTITFPAPLYISWAKVRMGTFVTDRARALAFETSVDGVRWKRKEVPTVVDGIRWEGVVPVENSDGDVDIWVNERGVRAFRLVNLGESSRFDWSIAELEIDGKPYNE